MLFKVESRGNGRSTHCGVLEFSADEGMVYMPYWVCKKTTMLSHQQRTVPLIRGFMRASALNVNSDKVSVCSGMSKQLLCTCR